LPENAEGRGTTPLRCFLEVLILKDFKSFEPEVLIPGDFKSLFPEVLILVELKPFIISGMRKLENFLEVLILGYLRDGMGTNGRNRAGETAQRERRVIAKTSRGKANG
jgi:hypothetical protein